MAQQVNTNVFPYSTAEIRSRYGTQKNPMGVKIPKAKGKKMTPEQLKTYFAGVNFATVPIRAY